MTKREDISARLAKPLEIGDYVDVNVSQTVKVPKTEGKGRKKETVMVDSTVNFHVSGKIYTIKGDDITIIDEGSSSHPSFIKSSYLPNSSSKRTVTVNRQYVTQNIDTCEANPFVEQDWNSRINFYQSDIQQILWRIGYDRREKNYNFETFKDIEIPEMDWNPTVINEKGEEVEYQRPFCWSMKEKQLLIDSVYNNIEIGKIVVRNRSWNWVEKRINAGKIEHTTFKQIVDGKQRCKALLDFIHNKFPDSYGNYWDDLSTKAQRQFFSFRYVTFGELGEGASDKEVLNVFLSINHTGIPMSEDHIKFVKSLRV